MKAFIKDFFKNYDVVLIRISALVFIIIVWYFCLVGLSNLLHWLTQ